MPRGSRQRLLTGRILVGIPGEDARLPGGREQLEGVEDVDRQVAKRTAARGSGLETAPSEQPADSAEPGLEDDERVFRELPGRKRRLRGETEGGGELGDVQNRLADTIDEDRRNDRRPASCQLIRAEAPSLTSTDSQESPDLPRNSRAAAQLAQAGCQKRRIAGISAQRLAQPATAMASISISSSGSASALTSTIVSAG